jgi:mannose-6-phosphate isomerase-like protein (cupin superfamily)
MKKLTLSDFIHTEWSNRVFDAQEDAIEVFNFGDTFQVYVFHYPPGEVMDTHTHEEARLTFVRSGSMKIILEDRTLILKAGDLISLLPRTPHRLEVFGNESLYLLELVAPAE